jgi:hypothetical protein
VRVRQRRPRSAAGRALARVAVVLGVVVGEVEARSDREPELSFRGKRLASERKTSRQRGRNCPRTAASEGRSGLTSVCTASSSVGAADWGNLRTQRD